VDPPAPGQAIHILIPARVLAAGRHVLTISGVEGPGRETEAALGAKVEVPTIDGRSVLRVPPGTNSGVKLRLREKGVPSVRAQKQRGDQYVELQVIVPKPVDERVRELLKELEKFSPEDPRKEVFERAKA